jgi:membrane protease subunit HflC
MSRFGRLAVILLGVLIVLLLPSMMFTIEETEVGIVTRFGRPLAGVLEPGLHFKLPWPVDSVVRLDGRLLVFDDEPTELLTEDKKNVLVDSFLCWRVADPLRFTQTVKRRAEAEARLLDLMTSELGAAVGSRPMGSFINVDPQQVRLSEVADEVGASVDRLARESFGIEVVDFRINGFNLPPQNRASVIERMRAERSRIATAYRSEGEEEALKIEAQAAAERQRIVAEASGRAESVRGEGEAEALRLMGAAYAKDPQFYRFLRGLETSEKIIDDNTTLFLESDSKLLEALDGR